MLLQLDSVVHYQEEKFSLIVCKFNWNIKNTSYIPLSFSEQLKTGCSFVCLVSYVVMILWETEEMEISSVLVCITLCILNLSAPAGWWEALH